MKHNLEKLPFKNNFETTAVLKQLVTSARALESLNQISKHIPNPNMIINAISINEAKDSSKIENIVSTHDEIYTAMVDQKSDNKEAREVINYREAILTGFYLVKKQEFINTNTLIKIQKEIVHNNAGLRKSGETVLKDSKGKIVYRPPENIEDIKDLLTNLENYINNENNIDPLINLAIIHYQFESIHPFYDGNGRTGRILNILYLNLKGLLDYPILYLSKYINEHKTKYYKLLKEVQETNNFENWILFFLKAIEISALDTIDIIDKLLLIMTLTADKITKNTNFYSKELVDTIFKDFYIRIPTLQESLNISDKTAQKYLDILTELNILKSEKIGRNRIYINKMLFKYIKEFNL